MLIINSHIRFIEKFLSHFQSAFSKSQFAVFKKFLYRLFVDYKRLSLATIANKTDINYQRLQYFFSESNWDINELNDIRLKILKKLKNNSL